MQCRVSEDIPVIALTAALVVERSGARVKSESIARSLAAHKSRLRTALTGASKAYACAYACAEELAVTEMVLVKSLPSAELEFIVYWWWWCEGGGG